MKQETTRRAFLGTAAAGWTAGNIYGAGAQGRPGPNDTLNLGQIGCGARGRGVHIPGFSKIPGTRVVAVCDVNSNYLAQGRELAGGGRVAAYSDFRKLLEDKNVDAVIVGSNQQWHVLQTIAACQAGKDVFVEKPMGQSIGEGPHAIDAARKYNRIVQVGTQQRSFEHYQKAVELIHAGKLGEISEVKVWDYENYWPGAGSPADCAPPAELDWDFYVGPSPFRNYNPNMYYHYGYDWFRVAGAGHQVAWGVHHFDIVLWALQVKWPTTAYATGGNLAYVDNHEYPNTFSATVGFGPGPVSKHGFLLQYTMRTGGRRERRSHGKCFIGTEASMILDRSGYSIVREDHPGQGKSAKTASEGYLINPEETVAPAPDETIKHFGLFVENVKRRRQPAANLETLHHATSVAHLMNISWEVGRSVRWDGEKSRFPDDAAANKLVLRPYRAPWKLVV